MPNSKRPLKGPGEGLLPTEVDEMGRITADLLVRVLGLARVREVAAMTRRKTVTGDGLFPTRASMTLAVAALRDVEVRALARAVGLDDGGSDEEVFRRLAPYI